MILKPFQREDFARMALHDGAIAGLDTGLDSAFCRACVGAGVLYVPGELCFGDDAPKNFIRLSYGVLAEPDLAEAARRFVGVAAQM